MTRTQLTAPELALRPDVACHEHGTVLTDYLPGSWDHLNCQSWDRPALSRWPRGALVDSVLRGSFEGVGLRKVAERAGVDRKTARRYVAAAEASA